MNGAARIGFASALLAFSSFALAQQDVADGQKAFGEQYVATTSRVVSGFVGGHGSSAIIVFALH